jgi:hypothetical protein
MDLFGSKTSALKIINNRNDTRKLAKLPKSTSAPAFPFKTFEIRNVSTKLEKAIKKGVQ